MNPIIHYCQDCKNNFWMKPTEYAERMGDTYMYLVVCPHCKSGREICYSSKFVEAHIKGTANKETM